MSISKRDEGKKVNSNINVTPMVDVMLVLLIIFMVITPMLGDKVTVDPPQGERRGHSGCSQQGRRDYGRSDARWFDVRARRQGFVDRRS